MKNAARKTALITGAALAIATPLVAVFEGLETKAYLDPVGIPTICYGHTKGVKLTDEMTKAECDTLLSDELVEYMGFVDDYVYVPMTPERKAALTSFVYNVGPDAFKRSSLRRKLNAGDTAGACAELKRWVYAKGMKLRGLVRRRDAEYNLCMVGVK